MRTLLVAAMAALLCCVSTNVLGQGKPVTELKVKIEATELDKIVLLQKLNEHGPAHQLHFVATDDGFDYRIVFGTEQQQANVFVKGSGGSANKSGASASVFDRSSKELFRFSRANRRTDAGATNAAAKEIIKKLVLYRDLQTKR